MLEVVLQAKEAARRIDRCRNFPAAIVGNRGDGGGLPIRRAGVRREFETESGGGVRPGHDGIGSIAHDIEGNASERLAVTRPAKENGQCHDRQD